MLRRLVVSWVLALSLFAGSGEARATWQLYGAMDLGYSTGLGDVSGDGVFVLPFELSGSDSDVSPLLGGTFGVQIPMNEISPWEPPRDFRLPDWPVRIEFEAAGLREYEFKTDGLVPNEFFNTQVKTWSFMTNFWFDIPLGGLHRPIVSASRKLKNRSYFPRTKRALDALTWYFGAGIGVANLNIETGDPQVRGSDEFYNFGWQAGTGFGYQATDRINLSIGYRYYNPGKASVDLYNSADARAGTFDLKTDVHEARFSVRVLIYDLPYPWRH